MNEIDWNRIFGKKIEMRPGLSDGQIATFSSSVQQPLTTAEFEIPGVGENVKRWKLPEGPLPESYLNFLRWSDGGEFCNGDRLLQFFPALDPDHGVRTMMLLYLVPERFPGLLPFAFNGGGIFYAFDMRMRPHHGEYDIVAAECGYSHKPGFLASTFIEVCESHHSLDDVWEKNGSVLGEFCPHCYEQLACSKCGRRIRD